MSQENHFPSTFQSERSWSVLNDNLIDDDDKYRFYPSFNSETWSVLGSQDTSDRTFNVSAYGYPTEDGDSRVREYLRDQQQQRFAPSAPVVENISSPPISSFPEPEFAPSLNASTKEFLENTFKYDRKSDEDFVGRPNEFDDDNCSPSPSHRFLSSNFINDGLDSDQTTTVQDDQIHHEDYRSSQSTITKPSSKGNKIVWTFIAAIIAIVFYYILHHIPNGELEYSFF